jgi:hypothetical protein
MPNHLADDNAASPQSSNPLNALFASSFFKPRPSTASSSASASTPLTAQSSTSSPPQKSLRQASATSHRRSFSRSSTDSWGIPTRPSPLRRSISLRAPFVGRSFMSSSVESTAALDLQAHGAADRFPQSNSAQHPPLQRAPTSDSFRKPHLRRANTENSNMSYGNASLGPPAQIGTAGGPHNPQSVYQQILDTAAKRIQTLDYLRKTCVLSPRPVPS